MGGAEPLFRSQPSPSRSLERPLIIPTLGLKPRPHSQGSLGTGRQDRVVHTGHPRGFSTFFCETSPVPVYSRSAWGPVLGWYPLPIPGQGVSPYSREEAPKCLRGSRVPGRDPVAGGREAEEKGMGGGASSSRQREQQIAPSQ